MTEGWMDMKKWIALFLGGAFLLGLLASCGQPQTPEQDQTPPQAQTGSAEDSGADQDKPGTAAAMGSLSAFTATTVDGGTFTQDDIASKDVTVVNFWSLTCAPCIAEMPDLAGFANALPDTVQVVTVCLDGSLDLERTKSILAEAGFEGVTLVAGDGDLQSLCANLLYTPTTVFADSEGSLIGDAVIGGQRDLSGTFLEAVNQVLTASGKEEVTLENQ